MLPKLNLFIDLQRRLLNGTGGRTSNLLLKRSRVFSPVMQSSPTTTLLFQLGSSVTHRVLEYEVGSFIAILMALGDRSPMFLRFCPNPSGITVRSRKSLWRLSIEGLLTIKMQMFWGVFHLEKMNFLTRRRVQVMLTLLVQFQLLLFRWEHWIQRPCRRKQQGTLSFLKSCNRRLADFLSTLHGCLLYGTIVVIPSTLHPQVLKLLHEGHFGIQQMKQLARTAVY